MKSWRTVDPNGQPMLLDPIDVHGADYRYDELGYLVELKYVDAKLRPAVSAFGHMGFARNYDVAGNRLSYHFIDAQGVRWQPPNRGYAGQNYRWRDDGRVRVRAEYVDVDGALVEHPERGFAAIAYEFDENGDVARRTFFDATNSPLFSDAP